MYLGKSPDELLGNDAGPILSSALLAAFKETVAEPTISTKRLIVGELQTRAGLCEVSVFRSGERYVLEIEPIGEVPWSDSKASRQVTASLDQINRHTDLNELLTDSVTFLYELSGYDRIMAYQFADDGSGEVVAEHRVEGIESFLGLRFPSWDIPDQARDIMKRIPLRSIVDVDQTPVPIVALDPSSDPLDISIGRLRGVSPVHLEYLRNMGVKASMTLSVVVDGVLWGMISFHHYSPKCPSPQLVSVLLSFIQYFNLKVALLQEQLAVRAREKVQSLHSDLLDAHVDGATLAEMLTSDPMPLMNEFKAQGMMLHYAGEWHSFGATPDVSALQVLIKRAQATLNIVPCTNLSKETGLHEDEFDGLAGALVTPLGGDDMVIVLRRSIHTEIRWAGAPKKDVIQEGQHVRLSPRGSFALYMESVSGECAPWRPIDRELAAGMSAILLQSAQQKAEIERRFFEDQVRQQKLMISELNHRVRNILALIRSISRQARRHNSSLDSYAAALERRIKALAIAHDLSTGAARANVSVREIIETEVEPFSDSVEDRIRIEGPDAKIRVDLCPIFALVLHELMTNANKYGAFSVPNGRIEVDIGPKGNGYGVRWREVGGPPVKEPLHRGFGTTLIEQAIPFEMDGSVDLTFEPTGVIVEMWLPDTMIDTGNEDAGERFAFGERLNSQREAERDPDDTDRKVHILLLEDNFVIAMDMEDALRGIGYKNVSLASNVDDALAKIEQASIGLAILDMHLGGPNSFGVARELIKRGIPYMFITGYGSDLVRPADLTAAPVLTKPVEKVQLVQELKSLLD